MTVATFDTLKYFNTLKAAGVPDKQAEAQADVLAEALAVNLKDLVTKDDLLATEQRLDAKIDKLGARLDTKTELLGARLDTKIDLLSERLDTKIDLLGAKLDAKIDLLSARLDGQITLLRWMFGASSAFSIAVLALLARLLFKSP